MEKIEIYNEIITIFKDIIDKKTSPEKLLDYHPYDIASSFIMLDSSDINKLNKILPSTILADIYEYIEKDDAASILEDMDKVKAASILNEMMTDDATDVINEMSNENVQDEYIKLLDNETKEELTSLSKYSENTVGAVMTTNFIEVEEGMDIKEVMKHLVSEANDSEIIDPIFVKRGKMFLGCVSLKNLFIARSPQKIENIIDPVVITVDVNDEVKVASDKISNYGLYAIACLDKGEMVGIVTMDDVIDIVDEEANDDYEKFAAVSFDIEEKSTFKMFLKRVPWLLLLLILSMFTSSILTGFEGIIKKVTVLVFFQSIILDTAGNSGTQSLAVTIRSLSRGELSSNEIILKRFSKEFLVGIINGIILGILSFFVAFIFLKISNNINNTFLISLVVALSIMISLFVSSFNGAFIPVFLHKIKIDPAIASGPFITTINDIIALVIYFSIANIMLSSI